MNTKKFYKSKTIIANVLLGVAATANEKYQLVPGNGNLIIVFAALMNLVLRTVTHKKIEV
jgi:hypothetical protein